MLAVGGIGVDRHRAPAQFLDQAGIAAGCDLRIGGGLVAQALGAQPADTEAQEGIGQQATFGEAEQASCRAVVRQFHGVGGGVHRSSLGNHGNNIGVVRW